MKYGRYVSNHILESIIRPQRPNECAINTVTETVNILLNTALNRDDMLTLIEWNIRDVHEGKMGNADVLDAITRIGESKRVKINADVFFRQTNDRLWMELKHQCLDKQTVLIYHADDHYALIAGFFEDPDCRYIVLAEHSKARDPIRVISWELLNEQLSVYQGYAVLRVSKKGSV